MQKKLFTIVLFVLSFSLMSQKKNNDTQSVITTIENYFYGYIERDIDKLNTAFDIENGTMKILSKDKDGKESFQNEYFKNIIPKWATKDAMSPETLKKCSLKILNLDITEDTMGVAKIEMKLGKATYIDMLCLQKLNGDWKITNKFYLAK